MLRGLRLKGDTTIAKRDIVNRNDELTTAGCVSVVGMLCY
jgi:hypothetical protein